MHLKASVAFQIVNCYEILTNHNMSSSASFSLLSPINAFKNYYLFYYFIIIKGGRGRRKREVQLTCEVACSCLCE